jgi:nitrite reductase/ring-hydroxylating ferredoxin subunit
MAERDTAITEAGQMICHRDDLVDGGKAVRFTVPFPGRALPCFVFAFDGAVHAFVNICPHKGTELDWQPGEVFDESGIYLICATHGAMFAAESGLCVGGPCQGAGLTRVAVDVKDGQVILAADESVD